MAAATRISPPPIPATERAGEAGPRRIGREVPGFAGFYLDENERVVIRVAGNAAVRDVARQRVLELLQSMGRPMRTRSGGPLEVVFEDARFSFEELATWRDAIFERLMVGGAALTLLDVDERTNVIRVGVTGQEDVAPVLTFTRSIGAPDEAIAVTIEPPAEVTQLKHLIHRWRPLIGGTEVRSMPNASGCTMSFAARWNGLAVIMTTAHCSSTYNSVDGGAIQQPKQSPSPYPAGYAPFGAELADSSWQCASPVNPNRRCRDADVSVYSINSIEVLTGETPFHVGWIAKPEDRVWGGLDVAGSLWVETVDPYLTIHDGYDAPPVGEVVEKVGLRTGWTYGFVRYTCEDRYQSATDTVILCSDIADINQEPGDSGSPVFYRWGAGDNDVLLVGIAWGRVSAGTNGTYSNLAQIRKSVGNFSFAIEPF